MFDFMNRALGEDSDVDLKFDKRRSHIIDVSENGLY